jgi:hypothetical protein
MFGKRLVDLISSLCNRETLNALDPCNILLFLLH